MEAQIEKLDNALKNASLKAENNSRINISDIQNKYLKEI